MSDDRSQVAPASAAGPATHGETDRDDHLTTLQRIMAIADTITDERSLHAARDLYRHARETFRQLAGPDEWYERATHQLAVTYGRLTEYEQARPLLLEVLAAYTERHGPDSPLTCDVRDELAIVELMDGDPADAVRLARVSREARQRTAPAEVAGLERTLQILAEACDTVGDQAGADEAAADLDRIGRAG